MKLKSFVIAAAMVKVASSDYRNEDLFKNFENSGLDSIECDAIDETSARIACLREEV